MTKSESVDFKQYQNKQILIAPLNWGLGHATRCVPIIHKLLNHNNVLTIASDGLALDWLKSELKNEVKYLELPAYNVNYNLNSMMLNMIMQYPKIRKAILKEHTIVKNHLTSSNCDLIISDNRYGCYNKQVPSNIITHQLNLPIGTTLEKMVFNRQVSRWIAPFDQVWVPDEKGSPLSGNLSIRADLKLKFCGTLSRFKSLPKSTENVALLFILSGPEPRRSNLEETISKLPIDKQSAIIVRGTDKVHYKALDGFKEVHNLANTQLLNELIERSALIITRAGYSSLMDLEVLGKKAVFIPTPGQKEQLYLAELHKHKENWSFVSEMEVSEKLPQVIQDLLN